MTERASQSARRPAAEPSWSQVWHLPMLLLGAAIFVLGLFLAWPQHEPLDFDVMLKDAAVLLAAHNLDEAQQQLQKVQTYLEEYPQQADPEHQARFWELMGDLTYLQQHAQDVPGVLTEAGRSNYQKVVGYYHQAQEIGQGIDRPLNQQSMQWLSRALVRLGQDEAALAVVDQLKTVRDRYMVIRDLIEHRRRNNPTGDPTRLVPLLERFKTQIDQELNEQARLKQQLWLVQVQARLHLDADDPQWAIDHLLLWLQRLQGQATVQEMAPLYVLLAQAYQQEGDLEEARRYYLFAQQQIDRTNGLTADILVGLGRIALAGSSEQGVHEAIALLSEAVKNYPSEPAYVDALIGLADCQARVEDFAGATEHFRLAVAELVESAPAWDARRQRLVEVVRSHIQRCADQQLHEQALQMLTLLLPLYGKDLPPPLLLDFAATHEQIAQKRRAQAQQMATQEAADAQQGGRATTAPPTVEAQRLANQEAAIHFTQAAQYYLRHARAVTIADDAAHGESLWRAAVNFDRAQRWKDAITVYAEFIETRRSDPLHLRAIHQLGKAYLADGQPQPAADLFLQLVENHPNTPETYESLVPLARAYLAMDQTDAAERTLKSVVTDHPAITPESQPYREALIELGKLYYRLGEQQEGYYVQAIERLSEAVDRYGATEEGASLRFLLADSYRKSVRELDRLLEQRQAQQDQLTLQAERTRRLEQAQMYYNQAINDLEARPPQSLSPLEKLYLRNAYFYQADCAYDRRQFELAIDLYSQAAQRWEHHPASLVALVQIVNAHCELGQYQQARVANARARNQLERIPDEAFQDQTLPMSRQQWEDWLRWTSEADLFGTGTQASAQDRQSRAQP